VAGGLIAMPLAAEAILEQRSHPVISTKPDGPN
jgi:hypothetical protein